MLDRLEAAFNRQRQFTADASHELRTPITIVGLEAGRALESPRSAAEYSQTLQVIRSENEFMGNLVGSLLTLARLDSERLPLDIKDIDLSELVLELAERYAPLAAYKNVELKLGELAEIIIAGDAQYLSLMTGNLIDNSLKYANTGNQAWVKLEVEPVTVGEKPYACLRVSDNGTGIAAEHLPHIFDRFYQADPARSYDPDENGGFQGSGLGLSIVKQIVEKHSGSITVTSEPGKGTVFEILLPLLVDGLRMHSGLTSGNSNKRN